MYTYDVKIDNDFQRQMEMDSNNSHFFPAKHCKFNNQEKNKTERKC